MNIGHCFISYSNGDADDFGPQLAYELEGGTPYIDAWFDKRDILPGQTWDEVVPKAIAGCKSFLFVLTNDSVAENSICFDEWDLALKYKKPILILRLHKDLEAPFRLSKRQIIDFSKNHKAGLAKLHLAIQRIDSDEGKLESLQERLADAERDLVRATQDDKPRIKAELDELTEQIKRQEEIVRNPKAAEEKTEKNIQSGLERERQPEKPVAGKTSTRFINPPPGIAPNYFQDRFDEIKEIKKFLENDSQRLMTIVGRAGVGKTAMVCRLLKALERGELPDDLGEMKADGIVYLSETGSHRVNFANVFADLIKLLPPSEDAAGRLEGIYKNPQTSTGDKMRALLDAFPSGRVILLLDNFETLIDPESQNPRDSELSEALNALLGGQHHAVKAVITTRIAPRDLAVSEPGRQHHLSLDEGLESPYAENVLREMDADGRVGLKSAPDALLNKAREKTRGYPRALEALYAILSVDRYTTLEELLELPILPENVVVAYVGEAFNRLDPSAQKVMQALAVYNRPVSPAAIDYLLQPHLPSIDSALALNRLVNMHFARREAGRYYLHPADKEYAFSLIENREQRVENSESPEPPTTNLQSLVSNNLHFTQHDLLNRAADYFAQARKPRAEWKKLDDLAAQLAEFELRCEAGDYDTAASVLTEFDFDYLLLWGHYRLMIELHEGLQGKISESGLNIGSIGNLGSANYTIGQVEKAIKYYEKSLLLAREQNNHYTEIAILSNLGNAYTHLGDTHKAIEYHEDALVITRDIGSYKDEGKILGNLGNTYYSLGDARKAIKYYKQALVITRDIGNHRDEGTILGNLGGAYYSLSDVNKAIEFLEQGLIIAREIGDRQAEGNDLGNIGKAYHSLGDLRKAIEYDEQALVIAQDIGNRKGEGANLGNLGNAYAALGDTYKAIEFYEKALVIARDIGDHREEGNDLNLLGSAHSNLGDIHKAIDFQSQALVIIRQIGDRNGEGAVLNNLGNRYGELGDSQNAIYYYKQSLEIEQEIGDKSGEAVTRVCLSSCFLDILDIQNSMENNIQAIQIADEISLLIIQQIARLGLAETYLFQNDLINARVTIEAALQYDVSENNHNASALHGIIALRQGEKETAQEAFAKSIAQADEILAKTPDYYDALDAKGLAVCGLLVIGDWRLDGERDKLHAEAIETFKRAREIAPHAGVVKSVLRLFDELVKCDTEGILKEVRKAAEGV